MLYVYKIDGVDDQCLKSKVSDGFSTIATNRSMHFCSRVDGCTPIFDAAEQIAPCTRPSAG